MAGLAGLGVAVLRPAMPSAEPRAETIYDFTHTEDGGGLRGTDIIVDPRGVVYGTTTSGGLYSWQLAQRLGRIFRLLPPAEPGGAWIYQALHDFQGRDDGVAPTGAVLDRDGNLYGGAVTLGFGGGLVWRLAPPAAPSGTWRYEVLHRFSGGPPDWYSNTAPLVRDRAGNLYGHSCGGGGSDLGTVFRLAPPRPPETAWTVTVLHSFEAASYRPACGLPMTLSSDGQHLFGVEGSDPFRQGVFELRRDVSGGWTHRVIYRLAGRTWVESNLLVDGDLQVFGLAQVDTPPHPGGFLFALSPPAGGRATWSHLRLHGVGGVVDSDDFLAPGIRIASGPAGAIFGASEVGGERNRGWTWRADPPAAGGSAWSLTALTAFVGDQPSTPSYPSSGLVAGPYRNFGGVFEAGGRYGYGGIFRQTTR